MSKWDGFLSRGRCGARANLRFAWFPLVFLRFAWKTKSVVIFDHASLLRVSP